MSEVISNNLNSGPIQAESFQILAHRKSSAYDSLRGTNEHIFVYLCFQSFEPIPVWPAMGISARTSQYFCQREERVELS